MLGPPETLPKTGGVLSHPPDEEVHPAYVAATGVLVLLAAGMLLAGLAGLAMRRTGR